MTLNEIDFLIIGSAKSATTWLQKQLQQDPAIYMPDPELHYFSRYYEKGDQWYFSHFTSSRDKIVGEKSNTYLSDAAAPARIREALGEPKLIAQLRNPVDRAYSDYCMLYRRGEVCGQIELHLDPATCSGNRFLQDGLYGKQVERYFDLFPAERFLIVLYEEIHTEPNAHLNRLRKFLNLAESNANDLSEAAVKTKDKEAPMLGLGLRRLLHPIKPLVAPLRNQMWFKQVHKKLARPMQYPALQSDLRRRLTDFFAKDIEHLSRIADVDLSQWTSSSS